MKPFIVVVTCCKMDNTETFGVLTNFQCVVLYFVRTECTKIVVTHTVFLSKLNKGLYIVNMENMYNAGQV